MLKKHLHKFLSLLLVCWGVSGYSQTYCVTSPSTGGSTDIITKVSVSTVAGSVYTNSTTYSTAAPAYYTSYANTPINLPLGTSNTISITFGSDGVQFSAVWIDYNRDGVFQASENIGLATSSTSGSGTKTYTFTVPAGTALGLATMRVRGGSDNVYTVAGACTASSYGETEDYKVNITAPACLPPTAITSSNVTATSATVSFTAPTNTPGNGYDYFYTSTNTPPAANATPAGHVTSSPIAITGDFENSPTYVWVRSSCSALNNSPFSATAAIIDRYCTITGSTSTATYISSFQTTGGLLNIVNTGSLFSAGGYLSALNKSVTQKNGGSVSFSATVLGGTVGIAIWVDWNDNGVFDSGERVYTSGSNYVTSASGSFTVPSAATPGKHRMRVVADYYTTTPTACGFASGGQGEVEDYTFNVQPKAPVVTGTAIICPGSTTAISASGCTGIIKWSNGATGSTINVPAGTYKATCTVDSIVGLVSTAVVVTNTPVTTPVIAGATAVCSGTTATLTANSCSGTIAWSNGETGSSINALPGSYTATCTLNGCVSPASAPAVVTETVVTSPAIAVGATSCPAGTAILTASNYTGDVIWSDGQTGASITAPAGTYTATSSLNGCVSAKSNVATVDPCPACPMGGNLLVNGSFDDADFPATTDIFDVWRPLVQPGWNELANGNEGLFETWKDFSGNKFMELNYLVLGIITQDVDVTPNQPLTLSFDHKARYAVDSEVVRMDVVDLNTNQIINTITSAVKGNIWQHSTTTFTPTSNKIEIKFTSLNASKNGTDLTLGNFLDNVALNYSSCICSVPFQISGDTVACLNDLSSPYLRAEGCTSGVVTWTVSDSTGVLFNDYPIRALPSILSYKYTASCTMPGCPTKTLPEITITQKESCSDNAQQRGMNSTSIAAVTSLSVAPNPVMDAASLRLSGFANGEVSIQITNLNGSVISNTKSIHVNGIDLPLDMSPLRAGMYFVKAQQAGKVAVTKVVKK